jgi:ParB family transcriptional regulator, chromosome partitioning protein
VTAQVKRLGRGLDALLPVPGGGERVSLRKDFFLAGIEDVHPSPDQPRTVFDEGKLDELAQSIRSEGMIQPLVVRERPGGGFVLIAGERRWRAAQRAGLHEVPVVVRNVSPAQAFELALVENIQRADLDPIEEAEAYRRLCDDHGYTQEALAERVGKERATVANALRLLKLPASVRQMVHSGTLTMGHARALLGVEDAAEIETTARRVAQKGLSVRATEDLVRRRRPPPAKPIKTAVVRDLEDKLMRALGTRVQVRDRGQGRGGTIEIKYLNLDDLDRILDRLL